MRVAPKRSWSDEEKRRGRICFQKKRKSCWSNNGVKISLDALLEKQNTIPKPKVTAHA